MWRKFLLATVVAAVLAPALAQVSQCKDGEEYMTCIPAQEGTCADSDSILAVTCTPGCSCMEGYVRHEGKCITFTDCPVVAFFSGGNSYSVLEGDGICLSLRVSGNVNRDFEVTMNLGKQFAADNSGTAPCCTPPEAGVVCGGSVSCNIPFKTGEEFLCVYIKMDGDDILEEDKTVTLNLTSGDGIVIRDPGELMLLVIDDDFNALTFETTAYYYTESKLADNNYVRLSKAPNASAFAELLLEGGDGDTAAAAGLDFQSGVIQPYFNVQTQRALFYVPIVKDKMKENAECFYMTLRSPKNGDSYNPEIRAWSPSRAVGWIQSTRKKRPPTSGRGGFVCFNETVPSQDVCKNDVVALVTFESEIDSKNCSLGWRATLRGVFKGQDILVPRTAVNIFVLPVKGCNVINFKRGELHLVAGSLETAGAIGVIVHDVSVGGKRGEIIWDSKTSASRLDDIMRCIRV